MNYMGILFPTDFWTEKQIPHPREGKKIPPPRASPSGEEFFNLPLGEEFVSPSKNPLGIGYSIIPIIYKYHKARFCFTTVIKKNHKVDFRTRKINLLGQKNCAHLKVIKLDSC